MRALSAADAIGDAILVTPLREYGLGDAEGSSSKRKRSSEKKSGEGGGGWRGESTGVHVEAGDPFDVEHEGEKKLENRPRSSRRRLAQLNC